MFLFRIMSEVFRYSIVLLRILMIIGSLCFATLFLVAMAKIRARTFAFSLSCIMISVGVIQLTVKQIWTVVVLLNIYMVFEETAKTVLLMGISFHMRLVVFSILIHRFVIWENGKDRIVVDFVGISFLMRLVVTHLNP